MRTLVTGLYANKKRAPLREIWTNALDESETVDVHLPSIIDPRVVIRDFGPGLSHDDVMRRITQIGGSTKRDRDDLVGCLGYGMKSPFAYVNQFCIRSFYQGEVRTYTASMEANYRPRMVHLATRPTQEPSGLEVSWNVKTTDIEEFRREARITFFGARERTNITNETWTWPELELVAEGAGWKLYYQDKAPDPERTLCPDGCRLVPARHEPPWA